MHVEQSNLADDRGSHKIAPLRSSDLWTNFQAITTRNTARKRIRFLLRLGRQARTFTEVISAVDGNPRLDALQTFEHELPVDGKIANHGKFRHRLEPNRLLPFGHQR